MIIERAFFPPSLRDYSKAPKQLFYEGEITLLNNPCVAIIGTRDPSPLGYCIAHSISAFFASQGYTIVSGLAVGCDTAAHEGALSVNGKTIAILGTSLDNVYPRENIPLSKRIVSSKGLLVTAYNDRHFDSGRFVTRNGLQAALSLAVIPVQAGVNSGTLHTCNAAMSLELNRHLFVPAPTDKDEIRYPEKYAGINQLINNPRSYMFSKKEDYPELIRLLKQG